MCARRLIIACLDFPAGGLFKPGAGKKKIVRGDSQKWAYFSFQSVLTVTDKVPQKQSL